MIGRRIHPGVWIVTALIALASGCGDDREHRESVSFHAQAVRQCLDRLKNVVSNPPRPVSNPDRPANRGYALQVAAEGLDRALLYLPDRIRASAETRVDERLSAAAEASKAFAEIRPKLGSLPEADVVAALDRIAALMDDVERD